MKWVYSLRGSEQMPDLEMCITLATRQLRGMEPDDNDREKSADKT